MIAKRAVWPILGTLSVIATLLNFILSGDIWSLSFLGFGIVGVAIAWKVPAHPTGRLMIGLSAVSALSDSEIFKGPAGPTGWIGVAMPLLMALFLLTFPSGQFGRRWWRPIALVALGVTVVGFAVTAATGDEGPYVIVPLIMFLAAAVVDLLLRFQNADGVHKAQMKYVVLATISSASFLLIPGLFGVVDAFYDFFVVTGITLVPVAVGGAILKYRLYDIDRIISRTLAYAILVTLLAGAYVGTVWAITSVLPAQGSLAVAGSTLAVAAIFNPIRRKVQQAVDRRFNRPSYEYQFIAEELSSRLRESRTVEELTVVWIDAIEKALEPSATGVWIESQLRSRTTTGS